ncbi:FtsX-like permease family protein [Streptomyces sp. NPDC059785]|uniref:FtsX-like permease family protein n=1 Tax=Streptomyces sp. NPDC059785 TaxID=3346945 RepID=UPI003659DE25
MLGLALLTLKARKGGFAGTFVALLLGAAVLSACGVLLESGLRSGSAAERYARADALVTGRQETRLKLKSVDGSTSEEAQPLPERVPVDTALAGRVARADGVREVVADTGATVRLVTRDGDPVPGRNGGATTAHNWSGLRLGDFRLATGRAPRTADEAVLDADLARRAGVRPGDSVRLMTSGTPRAYRVSGTVALAGGGTPRQSVVFLTDAAVRAMAPDGTADALGVLAEPGTSPERLAAAVGAALDDDTLTVSTGSGRGRAEFLDIAVSGSNLVLLATAIGGNVLLVAVFVLCSTTALSVRHRRREIALLRAVGTTPGQIRRMVAAEAAVTGAVAGVLGCPLGAVVVYWLADRFAGHGIVPPDFAPVLGPLPFLGAVAVTALTALVTVLLASRRATRIRPTEALGEAAVERPGLGRGRRVTGLVLLAVAAGAFSTGLTQQSDFFTLVGIANGLVIILVIAVGVLGPLLTRAALRLLAPLLDRTGVTGYLAAANTRANVGALAGAVVPLVLAIAFASTVVFTQTTALRESAEQTREGLVADHVLTSSAGLSPELADRVAELKQVKAATGVVTSKAVAVEKMFGEETSVPLSAQGVEPEALGATLDLRATGGDLSRLAPDTVAVSGVTASQLGLDVGDVARIWLGDGTEVRLRIVAVYERGLGFADLTLDHGLLLAHTTGRLDASVLVRSAPSAAGLDAALARLAADYPGTVVQDRIDNEDQLTEQRANAWVNYLVVGVIIAYTGVTVVNTQAMNTASRRREFALLRLSGTARRQVLGMMFRESLAVIAVGVGLGTLLALFPLALVALALGGTPLPAVPGTGYLAIAGATALLAATGTMVPTWRLLRIRPVEAIGTKE